MKYLLIVLILLVGRGFAYGQSADSLSARRMQAASLVKEKRSFDGYLVRLKPGTNGDIRFDILQNNHPVDHDFTNPVPFSHRGIQKKEDAFKIAQWIIDQHTRTGHWVNLVPPHVLTALKIDFN